MLPGARRSEPGGKPKGRTPGLRRGDNPAHPSVHHDLRAVIARTAAACLAAVLLATACQVPADPDGTLERVEGGTLRVGVTEHDPWVSLGGARPTGVEVQLIKRFAKRLKAELDFTEGSEAQLMDGLKAGELDLALGGFDAKSPWKRKAALTRPYIKTREPVEGKVSSVEHVMAVPLGENAWLVRLEGFLLDRELEAQRLLTAAGGP